VNSWQIIHEIRKGVGFIILACYTVFLSGVADGSFSKHGGKFIYSMLPIVLSILVILSPPIPPYREILDMIFQITPSPRHRHRRGDKKRLFHRIYLALVLSLAVTLYALESDHLLPINVNYISLVTVWLIVPLLSHAGLRLFRPLSWSDLTIAYFTFMWQFALWLIPYLFIIHLFVHHSYIVLFTPYWLFLVCSLLCFHLRYKNSNRYVQ